MAECQNVVTPRMIKKGQVNIGDKIDLEEEAVLVHGPAPVRMNNMNSMNNNSSERRMLSYENMTPYMNNTASSGTLENPSVILPQSPLFQPETVFRSDTPMHRRPRETRIASGMHKEPDI